MPWPVVALAVVLYVLRIFAIGARYHRAFSTSRAGQLALADLGRARYPSTVGRLAQAPSLEEIAVRARARLLELV